VSAVICLLFYGVGQDKAGVQDRNGALFFITLNSGFSALSSISQIFPSERPVFMREVNSGMYRVSSYFSAKIMTEMIQGILIPCCSAGIIYYIVGFNDENINKFLNFCVINVCMAN